MGIMLFLMFLFLWMFKKMRVVCLRGWSLCFLYVAPSGTVQVYLGMKSNYGIESLIPDDRSLPCDVYDFLGKKLDDIGVKCNMNLH